MRRRFLMKFALSLALLSASASTFGPAGTVLCVSASGHVELETGSDDCCGDAHASEGEASHTERCGCIDTPLLQGAARFTIGTERLLSAWTVQPLVSFAPPHVHTVTVTTAMGSFPVDRLREPVALSSLRSVVLLA